MSASPESLKDKANQYAEKVLDAVKAGDVDKVGKLLAGKNTYKVGFYERDKSVIAFDIKAAALAIALNREHLPLIKLLIRHGAKVEHSPRVEEIYPLHVAVWSLNLEIVRLALQSISKEELNRTNRRNNNALIYVLSFQKQTESGKIKKLEKIVALLLKEGIDLNHANEDGMTAIHWAARQGYVNVVRALHLSGADINATDNGTRGLSILHTAIRNHHTSVVQYLVDQPKINLDHIPDDNEQDGDTALQLAAYYGDDEIVSILVQKTPKDKMDVLSLTKRSALMWAARFGKLSTVQILVERGADINLTVIDKAIGRHTVINSIYDQMRPKYKPKEPAEKLVYLLDKGAEIVEEDIEYAIKEDDALVLKILFEYIERRQGIEAAKKLVAQYFVSKIIQNKKRKCAECILKNEVYFSEIRKDILGIFRTLLINGKSQQLEFLLELTPPIINLSEWPQVNFPGSPTDNPLEITPLAYACVKGFTNMVKILVKCGAKPDVQIPMFNGTRSAVQLAKTSEHNECAEILLQKMFNQNVLIQKQYSDKIKDGSGITLLKKFINDFAKFVANFSFFINENQEWCFSFNAFAEKVSLNENELLEFTKFCTEYLNRTAFCLTMDKLVNYLVRLIQERFDMVEGNPFYQEEAFCHALKHYLLSDCRGLMPESKGAAESKEITERQELREKRDSIDSKDCKEAGDLKKSKEFGERRDSLSISDGEDSGSDDSMDRSSSEEVFFEQDEELLKAKKEFILEKLKYDILTDFISHQYVGHGINSNLKKLDTIVLELERSLTESNQFLSGKHCGVEQDEIQWKRGVNVSLAAEIKQEHEHGLKLGASIKKLASELLAKRKNAREKIKEDLKTGDVNSAEILLAYLIDPDISKVILKDIEEKWSLLSQSLQKLEKHKQKLIKQIKTEQSLLERARERERDSSFDRKHQSKREERSSLTRAFPPQREKRSGSLETKGKSEIKQMAEVSEFEESENADHQRTVLELTRAQQVAAEKRRIHGITTAGDSKLKQEVESVDGKLKQEMELLDRGTGVDRGTEVDRDTENEVDSDNENENEDTFVSLPTVSSKDAYVTLLSTRAPKPNSHYLLELDVLVKALEEIEAFDRRDEYEPNVRLILGARDALFGVAARAMELIRSVEPVLAARFRHVAYHALDDLLPFSNHELQVQQDLYQEVKKMMHDIMNFLKSLKNQGSREEARKIMQENSLFRRIQNYRIQSSPNTPTPVMKKYQAHKKAEGYHRSSSSSGHSRVLVKYAIGYSEACRGALAATIRDNRDKADFNAVWLANAEEFTRIIKRGRVFRHPSEESLTNQTTKLSEVKPKPKSKPKAKEKPKSKRTPGVYFIYGNRAGSAYAQDRTVLSTTEAAAPSFFHRTS